MYYFNIILRSKCGSKYHKNKKCLALRATYHDIFPQGTEKALGIYVTQCLKVLCCHMLHWNHCFNRKVL